MDENIQDAASVRWAVTDPLGKKIILYDRTYISHIINDHLSKDAANRAAIEQQVQYSITEPRFVIKDREHAGRLKYLDLVDVPERDEDKIKTLTVIVDTDVTPHKVLTWIPKRSINEGVKKGEKIYDARMVARARLQV